MSIFARIKKNAIVLGAVALWIPAVTFGMATLWKYSITTGHPAEPPVDWPESAPVARIAGRASVVMFAHPQCGCSRASVGELALIVAHAPAPLNAAVFFFNPSTEPSEWSRTDLWQSAAAIPGVRVFEDRDGKVAQSFGVFTSGQTLLYDSSGRLLFKGGITAFRGHSGDNAGRSTITALLRREPVDTRNGPVSTPVFGCSLRGE
jgi:hypothetical protein